MTALVAPATAGPKLSAPDRPDEIAACRPCHSPIDLVHLAGQTLGDGRLEREILGLMSRQIVVCSARLTDGGSADRRDIAHALKGAASNVGAFALADAAGELERKPDSAAAQMAVDAEMQRVLDFIITLSG